jgi:hypothetical protein
MSWLFSQALVEEYLGDISLDGEQSVQSNGKPIQQAYCALDKMTKFSRLSRFGMMFKPLTESLGKELLMSYLEGFHAKTYRQQAKEQALMEKGQECGSKWHASFAKFDQNMFMWKIPQYSLLEDLESYSQTWPKWGSMLNGECWERQPLVEITKEKEFGLWPTPVTSDYAARRPSKGWRGTSDLPSVAWTRNGGKENPEKPPLKLNALWVEWMMGWPVGWTDLKPLEMDKYQEWQQSHGSCLKND